MVSIRVVKVLATLTRLMLLRSRLEWARIDSTVGIGFRFGRVGLIFAVY